MKRISLAMAALLAVGVIPSATADVYVKVDANGNAIGGAIVCDAATCGEGSLYSQLTLQPGERYVLQGFGQAGIGNNNPGVEVKVDIPTQTWTVTNNNAPEPTVTTFTPQQPIEPAPVAPVSPILVETSTVTSDTATVLSDTSTVTSDTSTVTMAELDAKIIEIRALITWLEALLARLFK
jgi:hypothetical protein